MKANKPQAPVLGAFKSTPIMAANRAQAAEILSRCYTPDRWTLRPCGSVKMHAGGYNRGWFFWVCPARKHAADCNASVGLAQGEICNCFAA